MKKAKLSLRYSKKDKDPDDIVSVWDFEVFLGNRQLKGVKAVSLRVDANVDVPVVRIETFDEEEIKVLISDIESDPITAVFQIMNVHPLKVSRRS